MSDADQPAEQAAARERLRQAITETKSEEQRLAALDAGRDRAREQGYAARSKLSECQDALREARKDDPQRIAYRFINGDDDLALADPVADLQAKIKDAQAEVTRLDEIETAIEAEIHSAQLALRILRTTLHAAMASVIVASDEYQLLVGQHRAAWKNLRSIRETLRVISASLHGQLPSPYFEEANIAEPLEPRVGYPIDREFVDAWAEAIAQLEKDAAIELPLYG